MTTRHEVDCSTEALQQSINELFPSYRFEGLVTANNQEPAEYEIPADDLNSVLTGKAWQDLTGDYLYDNPDDYVLMNEAATTAFIGAWLMKVAENPTCENPILSSLVHTLAIYGGGEKPDQGIWATSFSGLNPQQRQLILRIVECCLNNADAPAAGDELVRALENLRANLR